MTFEMLSDRILGHDDDPVKHMLTAIHNIMSRAKQKLKMAPPLSVLPLGPVGLPPGGEGGVFRGEGGNKRIH